MSFDFLDDFAALDQEFAVTTTQAAQTRPLVDAVVFISGPLETGVLSTSQAFRDACLVAEDVRRLAAQCGVRAACHVPHASIHVDAVTPREREEWLRDCLQFVGKSNVVFRYGGKSEGAERETKHAASVGVPVAYGLVQFEAWCRAFTDKFATAVAR